MKLTLIVCFCFCQVWASSQDARIVAGSVASAGQFPYAVALYHDDEPSGRRFCGGSIINNQWVLTAAHCIASGKNITLHIGEVNIQEGSTVVVDDSNNILHPQYIPTTLENNLGLIKLPSALQFTDNIKPISSFGAARLGLTVNVTAVGWGYTRDTDTTYSDNLRYVTVNTISNSECASIFSGIFDTMVCVRGISSAGTCGGDSGGPLIETSSLDGSVVQVGIGSFYSGRCEANYPSGFQRTFEYTEWIKTHAGEIGDNDTGNGNGDGNGNGNGNGNENGNGGGTDDGEILLSNITLLITIAICFFFV